MTIKTIIERMELGNLDETFIVEARNHIAVLLAQYNTKMGRLSSSAAMWISANREKYKSHAETERAWEAREDGQEMTKTKYAIRGMEALSDSLSTNWFLLQREWKESRAMTD